MHTSLWTCQHWGAAPHLLFQGSAIALRLTQPRCQGFLVLGLCLQLGLQGQAGRFDGIQLTCRSRGSECDTSVLHLGLQGQAGCLDGVQLTQAEFSATLLHALAPHLNAHWP